MSNECIPWIDDENDVYWVKTVCWDCCNVTLLVKWGFSSEYYNYQKMLQKIYNVISEKKSYYLNHDEMGLFLMCMNLYKRTYPNGTWGCPFKWKEQFDSLYNKLFNYWAKVESFITDKPIRTLKLTSVPWDSDFRRIEECCIEGKLLDEEICG